MSSDKSDRQFTTPQSYQVVDIQVNTPRYANIDSRGFNIRNMVSEINLYEHIDKPYITGNMFIADAPGGLSITNSLNIMGTENILIKLRTASNNVSVNGDPLEIEKRFVVTEIIAQNKIANPAKIPWPTLAYCKASSTSSPRPFAPISEATTTIARESMIV